MTGWRRTAVVLLALVPAACGEPPNKEMGQAQGAVDTARAAGAEQYAREEYTAATQALSRSKDAATQGDYKLALNEALNSFDHAQTAARDAATERAQVRGQVERELAALEAVLADVHRRLDAGAKVRSSREAVKTIRTQADTIEKALQEARARVSAHDYLGARAQLDGLVARARALLTVPLTSPAQSPRRRRR
jgi:predicted ribosome quality control (RQC) complex YloA/Tae2 family protein